ncbi:hypothetical protein DITRI_Ditri03aG0195400 [Diplodiscus trichospermus]
MDFFFRKRKVPIERKILDSKADYDELMRLFKRCDVNKDGKLSYEEVKAGFRRLQSRFPAYRTQRAFQMADQNRDGYIDEAELEKLVSYALGCYQGNTTRSIATKAAVQNMLRFANLPEGVHKTCQRKTGAPLPLIGAQLKSIFKRFDIDRDGRLSKQELRKAFASLGSYLPGWRVVRGLHQADCDGNGYVSDDKLDDLVEYAMK